MKREFGKWIIAFILFGIAFLSAFLTVFLYLKYPENREYFLKRLENARNVNPIKESIEMLKKKSREASQ